MNNKLKISLLLLLTALSTGCTTTVELNRASLGQDKIYTVNVSEANQNIVIELSSANSSNSYAAAGGAVGGALGGGLGSLIGSAIDASVDSKRKKGFLAIKENVDDFNVNAIFTAALEHNLEGRAFNEDVKLNSKFDTRIKGAYLVPVLVPRVVMSHDYSVINVSLITSTTQKSIKNAEKQNVYRGAYFSKQLIGGEHQAKSKINKKAYWLENPILLKEKVVNGLYDVAKQFADDFNADVVVEK